MTLRSLTATQRAAVTDAVAIYLDELVDEDADRQRVVADARDRLSAGTLTARELAAVHDAAELYLAEGYDENTERARVVSAALPVLLANAQAASHTEAADA